MKNKNEIKSPKFFEWLMKKFFPDKGKYSTVGDMHEQFLFIAESEGLFRDGWWYRKQVVLGLITVPKKTIFWGISMFANNFKIALRNIKRNKVYSIINITGIAVSIAACLLIMQYAGFELSYDQMHVNKENLYRLTNDRYQNGELTQHGVITYPSVAKTMYADYPEIVNFTRAWYYDRMFLGDKTTGFDQSILFADSAFFGMFSFPLIEGEASSVLGNPNSIVLSEVIAEKYFGYNWRDKNVIGKTLTVDNEYDVTVTGVFENVPANSHMQFDIVVSYLTLRSQYGEYYDDSWRNSNFMAYLQLAPGSDPKALEQKFEGFSEKYFKGDEVTGYVEEFYLQRLTDIHLYSDYEYETWTHGSGTTVTALLIIAGFILLITWVNYINLSTAKSMERAREIGVRKVVGAGKSQIIKQFFAEGLIYNIIGLTIAAGIYFLFKSLFSNFLAVEFSADSLFSYVGLSFVIVFLTGTAFSGLYPAFVASSFKTISVLKGKVSNAGKGNFLRKGLVVFQFALSFALIAGTYAVYNQIDYMLNQDLGININQVLVLKSPRLSEWDSTYINKVNSFKTELQKNPSIVHAATSRRLPGRITGRIFNIEKLDGSSEQKYTASDIGVDYNFFDTFGLKTIAGRVFDITDHNYDFRSLSSIVINESSVKEFNLSSPEEAIGKHLRFWGMEWEIIGVVKDHHQQSLHVPLSPIIFTPQYSSGSYVFVKLNTNSLSNSVNYIEDVYRKFFPGNSFNYFFLDEYFDRQYREDKEFGNAFTLFAGLGIMLSCMGLFGLSYFITAQRTKEIGIRKVAGATTQNILLMLFKDFGKLILIASILSSPVIYYVVKDWLNNFAYRFNFGWNMLIVPALAVFAVAIITVSYRSIKAASANPIDSIQSE